MQVWASQAYKLEKNTEVGDRRAWQRAELPQLPLRCVGGRDGAGRSAEEAGEDDQGVGSLGLIHKA